MRSGSEAVWWGKTRVLALTVLAVCAAAALAANVAGGYGPAIFDLPLGLFAGIVAVPLIIAAAGFGWAGRQQRLDRDFDVAED